MKKLLISSFILLLIAATGWSQDSDKTIRTLDSIAVLDQKVMVPMRDGIRLCTDIYRPKTDEPVPVIFSRTPYNFNSWGRR